MGERQWCPTDPNVEQKTSRKTSAGWGPFLGWGPPGPGFPIINPRKDFEGSVLSIRGREQQVLLGNTTCQGHSQVLLGLLLHGRDAEAGRGYTTAPARKG